MFNTRIRASPPRAVARRHHLEELAVGSNGACEFCVENESRSEDMVQHIGETGGLSVPSDRKPLPTSLSPSAKRACSMTAISCEPLAKCGCGLPRHANMSLMGLAAGEDI